MSDPLSFTARTRRELAKRRRPLTAAASLACHGLIVLALLNAAPSPPMAVVSEPLVVELVAPRYLVPPPAPVPIPVPAPDPAPEPPAPVTPAPPVPKPTPPKRSPVKARKALLPAPPDVKPLPAAEAPAADTAIEVSEAQLAGAATAGSGSGGGSGSGQAGGDCDMLARLQRALRKDPMVQSAVTQAHRGKAIMVWNGGWVRHPGQEGGGLAAVREAMMWEIGFAPEACRKERVRGLVVVSLKDGSGSARLVLGENDWRWSDLLFVKGTGGASQR